MNNNNLYTDIHNHFQTEKEECRQEGKIEGKIEGNQEGKSEIITAILNNGYSPKEIAEMTQLDIDTIEELKLVK